MKFEKAFNSMIIFEGGHVNDPDDLGGETKYGISKKSYPDVNIAKLTLADAKEIYFSDYWEPYGYDLIHSDNIASKVFNMTVNAGSKHSHKILQRALGACDKRVKWDGIIGPLTISATNDVNFTILLPSLRSEQAGYYEKIMAGNHLLEKYRKGWINRAYS